MKTINEMRVQFPAKSINEGFARTAVAAFVMQLDPTVDELADIKTAVSEAVTNSVVHAYPEVSGKIVITGRITDTRKVIISVKDFGVGIDDLKTAMEPAFTTGGEERSGMGFTIMETFMDKLRVVSKPGGGTRVVMEKYISER